MSMYGDLSCINREPWAIPVRVLTDSQTLTESATRQNLNLPTSLFLTYNYYFMYRTGFRNCTCWTV